MIAHVVSTCVIAEGFKGNSATHLSAIVFHRVVIDEGLT